MTEQRVWLPFPPSANGLFQDLSPQRRAQIAAAMAARGKKGRPPTRCVSKPYRDWRKAAAVYLMAARIPRYDVPVIVKLQLTPRDKRPRDADNYNKAIMDLLVWGRVLVDDDNRYVKAVIPYWLNPSPRAGVLVIIRPAVNLGRGALTPAETRLLAAITHGMTVPAGHKPSNDLKGLLEKGYVKPVPGLLDGAVQGYAAED